MKLKKKIEFIRLDLNLEIRNVHFGNDFFFFENKKIDSRYSYFDVDKKETSQITFQNFYKQLKNRGLHWKSRHLHYKFQLSNDEKFITKTLTWPKINWGIRSIFSNYNTIYVLRGNDFEKSVD